MGDILACLNTYNPARQITCGVDYRNPADGFNPNLPAVYVTLINNPSSAQAMSKFYRLHSS